MLLKIVRIFPINSHISGGFSQEIMMIGTKGRLIAKGIMGNVTKNSKDIPNQ